MPAFGTATVLSGGTTAPDPPAPAGAWSRPPTPTPGQPVQPVYARYWLHGKGPAPAGNLPVAVHFSPVRVALPIPGPGPEPDEAAALTLTVGCGAEPASGTVELVSAR